MNVARDCPGWKGLVSVFERAIELLTQSAGNLDKLSSWVQLRSSTQGSGKDLCQSEDMSNAAAPHRIGESDNIPKDVVFQDDPYLVDNNNNNILQPPPLLKKRKLT